METEHKGQLTVKEALEQGYKYCGFAGKEWQMLISIEDLTEEDFNEDTYVLAGKEALSYVTSVESIADLIADSISDNEADESGRDDDEVYKGLKGLDYTGVVEMINKELKKHGYRTFTYIKLIPNKK